MKKDIIINSNKIDFEQLEKLIVDEYNSISEKEEITETIIITKKVGQFTGKLSHLTKLNLKIKNLFYKVLTFPIVGNIAALFYFLTKGNKILKRLNIIEESINDLRAFSLLFKEETQLSLSVLRDDINNIKSKVRKLYKLEKNFLQFQNSISSLYTTIEEYNNKFKILENNLFQLYTLRPNLIDIDDIYEIKMSWNIDKARPFYLNFENNFRGSFETVKEKLTKYMSLLNKNYSKNHPVLDVGCGRGEFIEILHNSNIPYIGVDLIKDNICLLQQKGLNVINSDINSYLENSNIKFSNITAFHVVEHMKTDYLKYFLKLAYKHLTPKGKLIIETPNPWSINAFGRFYMDETHVRPIPPEYLVFLLQWIGFKVDKVIFSFKEKEKIPEGEDFKRFYADYAIVAEK
jgi:O-antigen chain-terminating methyltransferase